MFDKNLTVFVVICSAILCSKITNKKVFANVIENNGKQQVFKNYEIIKK